MFFHSVPKRLTAFGLVLVIAVTAFVCSAQNARAFEVSDIKNESRMELGYSIINGYSKLSERKGLTDYGKTAVYSGLDVTSPYNLALAGTFYVTQQVDLNRTMTDNEYAYSLVEKLNGFMSKMGVKNGRAQSLKTDLQKENIEILNSYDTVGMFIIKTDRQQAEALMENKSVDFVFAGAKVPSTMKDLNMDGLSNSLDAPLIQQYLAHSLTFDDRDENEYIKFAGDINGDKEFDINDATVLLR